MNALFNNRFFNALILLLMVANIFTIGFFWVQKNEHQPGPKMGNEKNAVGVDFIATELKMNETQTNQWIALKEEHKKGNRALRKNMEAAKDAFFQLVKNDSLNEESINTAWEKVNEAEKTIHINTLQHFNAIRKICTPEQKMRFDEIIQDAIRGMGRGGRPPGPEPGGERPPHEKGIRH